MLAEYRSFLCITPLPTRNTQLGEAFTLVDCALAPFGLRLGVLEGLCGYKVPADLSRVARWREAVAARPSVQVCVCGGGAHM